MGTEADAAYLKHIAQPTSAREVAIRMGISGRGIGGVATALSRLVRRGLAKFEDGKFQSTGAAQ